MRLTIIGATRGIGKALSEQARAAGHHVVAVGRSLGPAASENLTHVRGSILEEGQTVWLTVEPNDVVYTHQEGTTRKVPA